MAKQTSSRGGTSRIRFIVVEAELQDGELAQVTQVLQNAFKTQQIFPARPQAARITSNQVIDDESLEQSDEQGVEEEFVDQVISPTQRPPRKARSAAKVPNVVNDIDPKTDPSLKSFVAEYDVKSGFEKYLVIGLWLRDARSTNVFTVDHVYTCFKLLGWSTNSSDFSKPLRNLADNKFLSGDSKGYSLSLTGAGKIEDKKRIAE